MTKDCVKMVLDTVLENLKKYHHDKMSIWKCLEGVGKNHPWVVLPLVPQLLSMHPFFDTSEPDPEDPAYVSVLILVFNAAKGCNTMATLFDDKLLRHYHYLKDTLPSLVPELHIGSDIPNISMEKSATAVQSASLTPCGGSGRLVLRELSKKLKNAEELNPEMKQRLNKLILQDFKVHNNCSVNEFEYICIWSKLTIFLFRELPKLTKKLLRLQNSQLYTFVHSLCTRTVLEVPLGHN